MTTIRASQAMGRLLEVMARLRSPGGCPWDAAQNPESLRSYLVEETYEVLDAIDRGESGAIREELGDLLLQIVFQARIFEERGEFDLADVAEAITAKLIRRHPHVFAAESPGDALSLSSRWEQIKNEEKRQRGEKVAIADGVPRHFPALLRARKVADKVRRGGMARLAPEDLAPKAVRQLEQLIRPERPVREQALGDLLFCLAGLGAAWGIDPEEALRGSVDRFCRQIADQTATGDCDRERRQENEKTTPPSSETQ